jgi:hypothetical protein
LDEKENRENISEEPVDLDYVESLDSFANEQNLYE